MTNTVLFVCIHNSARSQMAEAFLKHHCPDRFDAQSAGIEPGKLNPIVVAVMQELGIDISNNPTRSVLDLVKAGTQCEYVITVCDETSAERCPVFPGSSKRLHWGFPDPSAFQGTIEEKLRYTREIRDLIERKVMQWCLSECPERTAQTGSRL